MKIKDFSFNKNYVLDSFYVSKLNVKNLPAEFVN
jgi:hypothetical protein